MTHSIKLTTRGKYAVMAMIALSKNTETKPVPLSDIAENGNISLSYLEQLIAGLRRHDLVKSYRGPGGGYSLAKPLSEISVADILIAAEDSTPAKRNGKNEQTKLQNCEHTTQLWDNIGELLYNSLKNLSLENVIEDKMNIALAA